MFLLKLRHTHSYDQAKAKVTTSFRSSFTALTYLYCVLRPVHLNALLITQSIAEIVNKVVIVEESKMFIIMKIASSKKLLLTCFVRSRAEVSFSWRDGFQRWQV